MREVEPLIIGRGFDEPNHDNYAIICSINNKESFVKNVFDWLTIANVRFNFYPLTGTWNCLYFPDDYITEVMFTIRPRQLYGMLLIERCYISGHHQTYNTITNTIVSEVSEAIYSNDQ